MAMMRSYMRSEITNKDFDHSRLTRLGLTERQTKDMYRLLAIAKHEDRFVIPTSHKEAYMDTYRAQGSQGYGGEYFGSNCDGCGVPVAVESGKSGQEIYNEQFYGEYSVINFKLFEQYQTLLGYHAQLLDFPNKQTFKSETFKQIVDETQPSYEELIAFKAEIEQYSLIEVQQLYSDTFDFNKKHRCI